VRVGQFLEDLGIILRGVAVRHRALGASPAVTLRSPGAMAPSAYVLTGLSAALLAAFRYPLIVPR